MQELSTMPQNAAYNRAVSLDPKWVRKRADVHADMSVGAAAAEILRADFDALVQWEDKAGSWDDIEGVHQMRVACRRMRVAISAFRPALPEERSRHWRKELSWIGSQLSGARDLDVFISEGLASARGKLPLPGKEKMLELAEQHRAEAYLTVRRMLDDRRYAAFRRDFPEWIDEAAWRQDDLSAKQRKKLDMGIAIYAPELLDRFERRVLEVGTDVDKNQPEQMHQLRKECKKLRYATEFFSPIIPDMDIFVRQMKGLQDLLGVLNDVSVMSRLLNDMLAGESDAGLLHYAGGLIGWRMRQSDDLLNDFEHHWHAFVHAKHPWWSQPRRNLNH